MISRLIDEGAQNLSRAGVEEARLDAEHLMASALGIPRLELVLHQNQPAAPPVVKIYERELERRGKRIPLAYILGEQPFLDICLEVTPAVMIPRPETELLVEKALALLDNLRRAMVVDVGTGSGNIAIALSRHAHVAHVFGIDISASALRVAEENAKRIEPHGPIRWIQGDLLAPLISEGVKADIIVANLPYIRRGELTTLAPEVRCEPMLALDGGPDGLELISALLTQAPRVLRPGGWLLLEIGCDQGEALQEELQAQGKWTPVQIDDDWAKLPRILRAQRKAS